MMKIKIKEDDLGEGSLKAAIDLGSNTFYLLIARVTNGKLEILEVQRRVVRLHAALDKKGFFKRTALVKACESIDFFSKRLLTYPIESVRVVGTAAFRLAKNVQILTGYIAKKLKAPVEIISGEQEAFLMYVGAVHALPHSKRRLVIDIGGGSTEFAVGVGPRACLYTESVSCGCIPLQQAFLPVGQMTHAHWVALEHACRLQFSTVLASLKQHGPFTEVVIASGIARSLETVRLAEGIKEKGISLSWMERFVKERLIGHSVAGAWSNAALVKEHQQILPTGLAILKVICQALAIKKVQVSSFALREGLLM